MSLTRVVDTDDDGSGLTGTIHHNAWLQTINDSIDARWSRVTITLTGMQDNLSISEADLVIFINATDLTITGIVAPASPVKPAKTFRFVCIGAGHVFFAHQSASSTAGNRCINFVSSGHTPCSAGTASQAGGRGAYTYDDVNSRWQLVAHEQGAWITPTFAAGDYTAATGTWTVAAGDVAVMAYRLSGRLLHVKFSVVTTDVSATPATLRRVIPGGFTSALSVLTPIRVQDAGAALAFGMTQPSGTLMLFYSSVGGGGWATATANTYVEGDATIVVT